MEGSWQMPADGAAGLPSTGLHSSRKGWLLGTLEGPDPILSCLGGLKRTAQGMETNVERLTHQIRASEGRFL